MSNFFYFLYGMKNISLCQTPFWRIFSGPLILSMLSINFRIQQHVKCSLSVYKLIRFHSHNNDIFKKIDIIIFFPHIINLDLNLVRQLTHVVTNQTGVYKTYDSTKAIDGKDRYDVNNCNCCSVTNGTVPSWWQIDLREKYLIDTIKIYGGGDTGNLKRI